MLHISWAVFLEVALRFGPDWETNLSINHVRWKSALPKLFAELKWPGRPLHRAFELLNTRTVLCLVANVDGKDLRSTEAILKRKALEDNARALLGRFVPPLESLCGNFLQCLDHWPEVMTCVCVCLCTIVCWSSEYI